MKPPAGVAWLGVLPPALATPVAVTVASSGTVLYANAALEELLGVQAGEIEGQVLDSLLFQRPELLIEAHSTRVSLPEIDDAVVVELQDISERVAAKTQLTEIARFPDMNPGPVLRLGLDGTVLRANTAALDLVGGDGLIGSSWLERGESLDATSWARVVDEGVSMRHESAFGEASFIFTYVPSPADAAVFAFGTDVTALREAERTAAELARFPDMNPGPVVRTDVDGTVLLANRAARDVLGEIIGASWLDLLPESKDRWEEIRVSTEIVRLETRRSERDFVFAHRADLQSGLVFVYGTDVTLQKKTDLALRQSERMATLGTLAAGVAHELNNPAAATRRAADQLRAAMARLEDAHLDLDATGLDIRGLEVIRRLDDQARSTSIRTSALSTVTRGDLETAVEDWLEARRVPEPWELASSLVELEVDPAALDALAADLAPGALEPALQWVAAAFSVYRLAHEISQGSARISEIVGALKGYSYLGQGDAQLVDLHESLDNTLVILRHKLKEGVDVRRVYCDELPALPGFGSELNQVWTNLIDNAVDAMGASGTITITTGHGDGWAVVTIEDDGPGIPAEHLSRVFDPFFTTKEPGKGTGLGLSTSYSIITEKHGGEIGVVSRPGHTAFTVRLPLHAAPEE